jgi:hypothetical protein
MADNTYARPWVDTRTGKTVMRTDAQVADSPGIYRKILPGETVAPVINPEVEIVPEPLVSTPSAETADTLVGDTKRYPVPEMRERRNL